MSFQRRSSACRWSRCSPPQRLLCRRSWRPERGKNLERGRVGPEGARFEGNDGPGPTPNRRHAPHRCGEHCLRARCEQARDCSTPRSPERNFPSRRPRRRSRCPCHSKDTSQQIGRPCVAVLAFQTPGSLPEHVGARAPGPRKLDYVKALVTLCPAGPGRDQLDQGTRWTSANGSFVVTTMLRSS